MMKSLLNFLLVASLILALAVPAIAAESPWIELLEYGTVNDSGMNAWSFTTSSTIDVPTPREMRCTKIDMLVTYSAGQAPSEVYVVYSGNSYKLTIAPINSTTARIYGDIPDTFYANLLIRFQKSSSTAAYYELLSCRVSGLVSQEVIADADVYDGTTYYDTGVAFGYGGIGGDISASDQYQMKVSVYDWMKYDFLTIWGSVTDASIESIRATIDIAGLPFTVSFMDMEASDYFIEDAYTDTAQWITADYGKYLFCITIDLSGVDRTLTTKPLYVYFTGNYETVEGMTFNCQYVNGSILIADTSEVTWWNRFTAFMTDLFGSDDSAVDEFAGNMESQATVAEDLIDELEQVTKPPVGDIDVDLSDVVSDSDVIHAASPLTALLSNELFFSMTLISLTLALLSYVIFGKR